jgi:hypothetical protein
MPMWVHPELWLRTVCGMTDEGAARATAEGLIATWPTPGNEDEAFVVWKVEEHAHAWILHVNTRRWIRTRDMRDQAIGGCPLVVEKANGKLHNYGSGGYEKFRAWLD